MSDAFSAPVLIVWITVTPEPISLPVAESPSESSIIDGGRRIPFHEPEATTRFDPETVSDPVKKFPSEGSDSIRIFVPLRLNDCPCGTEAPVKEVAPVWVTVHPL